MALVFTLAASRFFWWQSAPSSRCRCCSPGPGSAAKPGSDPDLALAGSLIVLLAGLAALYRYGPNRRAARWQWVSVGSVFASVVWIAASFLFSWYLAKFNTYNATYGSLGAVLAMMMWLWISSMVVLLGAELNAEIEHQTAQDSTVGDDKPLGQRGAVMADTVGAKQD